MLRTGAFESSSGERIVSFPLMPQAPTMHAIKCMILLFDRALFTFVPHPQLKHSVHHSFIFFSHPICLIISRATSSEDGNSLCFILSSAQNALSPRHTLQTFYNILRQKYSMCIETDSWVSACPLFFTTLQLDNCFPNHVSLSIWCGPELCFRGIFQPFYKTFLFIMSCDSFQSIHKKKPLHYFFFFLA